MKVRYVNIEKMIEISEELGIDIEIIKNIKEITDTKNDIKIVILKPSEYEEISIKKEEL